jgi:hypothetical protein
MFNKINLGVPVLKSTVDLTALPYLNWQDYGWGPGISSAEFYGTEALNYLHEDLLNLLQGSVIFPITSLFVLKYAPGIQTPIYRGSNSATLLCFKPESGIVTQEINGTGYDFVNGNLVGSGIPYSNPDAWGSFIVRPGTTDNTNTENLLKPGQVGLGGETCLPVSTSDDTEVYFVNNQCRSDLNTSSEYRHIVQLAIWNLNPEEVAYRLQPYLVV